MWRITWERVGVGEEGQEGVADTQMRNESREGGAGDGRMPSGYILEAGPSAVAL